MKRFIYISLLSLSLTGIVTSCDLDAPAQSAMEEPNLFSVKELAEAAVMGTFPCRFLPDHLLGTDRNAIPVY